jgi:hypothetical protein
MVNPLRVHVVRDGLAGLAGVVALLAVGALLATGCAGAPPSPAANLTGAQIAMLTNSGTAVASAEVNNALELLIQRCMQAKGLVYYPQIITAAQELNSAGLAGVPQAPIGLAAREADGYGFYSEAIRAAANPAQAGPNPEEKYADSAPLSYQIALNGPLGQRASFTLPGGMTGSVPAGGCRGTAERRLYGSVGNYVQATTGWSDLTAQLQSAVTADPAFSAVVARWSACMAKHSYKYSSPENLWNILARRIVNDPTPALRNLEIKTSVADYECAAAVKLVPTVQTLQDTHARYMGRTLAGDMARIAQILATALKVAKAMHVTS